jgi:hypothetical protein
LIPKEKEIKKEEKKIERPEINEEELMKSLLGLQDFDTSKVKRFIILRINHMLSQI